MDHGNNKIWCSVGGSRRGLSVISLGFRGLLFGHFTRLDVLHQLHGAFPTSLASDNIAEAKFIVDRRPQADVDVYITTERQIADVVPISSSPSVCQSRNMPSMKPKN